LIIYSDIDALLNNTLIIAKNELIEDMYIFLRINKDENKFVNFTNYQIKSKNLKIPEPLYKTLSKTLSGVIAIRSNENGNKIIKYIKNIYNNRLKEHIKNKNVNFWFTDQLILENLFFETSFKIGILNRKYFDLNLNTSSIILLSKGITYPVSRPKWIELTKTNEHKLLNLGE
jgi:hypothetical protein